MSCDLVTWAADIAARCLCVGSRGGGAPWCMVTAPEVNIRDSDLDLVRMSFSDLIGSGICYPQNTLLRRICMKEMCFDGEYPSLGPLRHVAC